MSAATSPTLLRIETLTVPKIDSYLGSCPSLLSNFTTQKDPVGGSEPFKKDLTFLDGCYSAFRLPSKNDPLRRSKQKDLTKLVSWTRLRARSVQI